MRPGSIGSGGAEASKRKGGAEGTTQFYLVPKVRIALEGEEGEEEGGGGSIQL